MASPDPRARYETLLRTHIPALRHHPHLTGTEELAHLGLDSLRTMSLLVAVEDCFGITFPEDLLTKETFSTPDALWSAVESLTATPHKPGTAGD